MENRPVAEARCREPNGGQDPSFVFPTRLRHLWLLPSLLLLTAAPNCRPQELELTILHTNDVHARIVEFDRFGSSCDEDEAREGRCFGGVARRATKVREIRAEVPNLLLVDAGDQFQGTRFYNRFQGAAAAAALAHLGYDAMVVGNHEFDDGPEVLGRFIDSLPFPVLGANIDRSGEPRLAGLKDWVVVERGGRRIGIIGFITEETADLSSPGETIDFLPIEEVVERSLRQLEADGVDIIIGLSHSGFGRDRALAHSLSGLDIIVGGHTNTLLKNDDPEAEGPYPVVVESPRGEPVLIVSAFAWGKYLGRLDVVFDDRGVLKQWQGDALLLDAQILPDPEATAHLAPMVEAARAMDTEVIGSAAVELVGQEQICRAAECTLGNLITDALLEAVPQAEVALHNGGGIRATLAPGPITRGQLLEVLPFGNTASLFKLTGRDLRATLEHGVGRAEDLGNDGTGRFLQVAGLRYRWSASATVGQRVRDIDVRDSTGEYRPLEDDRLYRVVCNDFNRTGGDGFTMLAERALDPYDQGRVLSDIVADYIRRESPVAPKLEGRIQRLP